MSPPPDPRMERYDGRKVRNPTRAGGSETSKADPSDSRNPEAQAGDDVFPPKGERVGIVTTSDGPSGWGECSGGEKPRKASTAGFPRESGDCTNSPRAQRPEGGPAFFASPRGCGVRPGNVKRAQAPRGVRRAVEENALKGEAQERSGAYASAGPVVDVAKGVAKPRTRHAAAEGSVATKRIRRPGSCCRAREAQGREHRPPRRTSRSRSGLRLRLPVSGPVVRRVTVRGCSVTHL
jgi:hypothetical protein